MRVERRRYNAPGPEFSVFRLQSLHMGKLIKIVVMLAILAGVVIVVVKYAGSSKPAPVPPAAADEAKKGPKKTAPELQEKYGYAPVNPTGD